MTPLALLRKIQLSTLKDDAVRVLLAIGSGIQRVSDIEVATALQNWQVCRMLTLLIERGLVEKTTDGKSKGRGKCTVYSLSGDGITLLREILAEPNADSGPSLPRPPTGPAPLNVRAKGFFFLQPDASET